MAYRGCYNAKKAFTLAELLVVLGLIGVISTFTIAKLISSHQNAVRSSVFKEFISTWSQALYEGFQSGELAANKPGWHLFFASKLNAVKTCDEGSNFTQGCWTADMVTTNGEAAMILPTGVYISNIRHNWELGNSVDNIVVDYNGPAGPNQYGQDVMVLAYCVSRAGSCAGLVTRVGNGTGGVVGVANWGGNIASSIALWDEVMNP